MPTTLTLKNIPDALYQRLKTSAARNHRSMNREAIVCFESVLFPEQINVAERLERARALRAAMQGTSVRPQDIDAFKREGRR